MIIQLTTAKRAHSSLMSSLFEALKYGVRVGAVDPDGVEHFLAESHRLSCDRVRRRLELTLQAIKEHTETPR